MKKVKGNWGAVFEASRKEQRISKIELVRLTGIPRTTLFRTLTGERDSIISISEFQKLKTVLNLKL